ncbi:hypothetical protein Ancab_013474 [Ancistrocladus abbreviatus]
MVAKTKTEELRKASLSNYYVRPMDGNMVLISPLGRESVASGELPDVASSPEPNPKVQNLFLGIKELASKVQQKPSSNDEVVARNFEFLRTSRAKEFSKDNGEELFNSDAEVAD